MEVIAAEWNMHNGQPNLLLTLDDGTANICVEQRILPYAPLVYLGGNWDFELPPTTRVINGQERTLYGFTDDPEIVRLTREFVAACRSDGDWSPRRIK